MPERAHGELTLAALLAVEDDPALLALTCPETDVPFWTAIRNPLMRFLMSDLVIPAELATDHRGANFRNDRAGAVFAVARSVAHNLSVRSAVRGSVLITTGSAGLQLREGRWFNRLSDALAFEARDDTVVIEDLFKWRWRWPRAYPQVLFHTPLYLKGQLAGRVRVQARHRAAAQVLVGIVRDRAKRLLGWEMGERRFGFLTALMAREAAAMPGLRRSYRRLFGRLGTRVILKEMGCYGRSAVFNAAAREMGLTVAEHQHGLVSAGHDAYNFAPAVLASEAYRGTLPQFFLSYGAWWGEQINAPLGRITLGNPHRSGHMARADSGSMDRCDVLVLGDGFRTEFYLDFARTLARYLPQRFRVVFRPHPLERAKVASAFPRGTDRVQLDGNADLYDSFASAYAIVSEASTGLFEAVGLIERIFVLETPRGRFSLPRHPFETCAGGEDLAQRIAGPSGGAGIRDAGRIWAPDWKDNYRAFLAGERRIEPASQAV